MKATTMKHAVRPARTFQVLAAALLAALAQAAGAAAAPGDLDVRFELRPVPDLAGPLPALGTFPIQLVLDDGSAEGTVGVSDANGAREFLWFNRFAWPGEPFDLEEVHVLFPPGVNMTVGDAVQLAVYHDPDGDPSNGADLLATFGETIQAIDGVTFSVYPLAPAVTFTDPGDVLIGVVPRFIAPGDPPTGPASVDTTASQQRSWIAIWTSDPPDPPELPPDLIIDLIDNIAPAAAGNWMIRGFGGPAPAVVIPALDGSGLALLALALAAAGFVALRRLRKRHGAAALGMVVLAAAAALAPAVPASAQVVIDEFTTNQGPVVDPPGGGSTAVTGGADILGGKRGVRVRNLAGPGPTSVEVAFSILAFTVEDTTPDSLGEADVIWDGDADNDPLTFDPTGLGGVDLTDGGTEGGIRFTIEQARAGTHLALAIYEDADHLSRAGRVLPEITSTTTVFINFGELIADPDAIGPADLTQVGAVTLRLGAVGGPNPPTLEINHIETAPPAVAAIKIDTVGGVDPGGPVTPGTTLRYRVTIDNPGAGGAEGVDFDDLVTDPNLGAPGPFRSTPLARRDQYLTVTDTPIDSAADGEPSLLGNDADPDGNALLAVAATGQPTSQGGSVDVAADGHFMYTPPVGFVGVDSFAYTLQATAGDPTTDAAGNPIGAAGSTAYVTIDRVPPEITAGGTLNYTENQAPTAIDPALTVVDVDSTNLFGATAQITGNYAMGEDVLGFVDAPPITGNWVPATGTLTLTGTDTVANYEAALQSVTYENSSDDPSTLSRTVTWTATDGSETSAPATSTINVTAVNDPPVITTTGGVTPFTEDGGPVVVDSMLTVTDADDTNLESATVSLASAPDGGLETLAVASPGTNCTGLAVTPGNPLTITGSALVATYETCLRNVTYDNASQDPNTTDRTVQFVANDGDDDSNTATKTVTVTAVNDPPVAGDDVWDTIGNTQLVVDLPALPTPHVLDTTPGAADGVRDNDADPAENDNHLVTAIVGCADTTAPFGDGPACMTANGGTVVMNAVGTFTYTPAPGDTLASDSFQYVLTDDGTPAPASDMGTVTINRLERVWYVDNDFGAGGNGTSASPLNTLTAINGAGGAGDSDSPNDYIFVHFGDGTATGQGAGLVLENGQRLIGEHAGLSVPVNLNGNGSPTVLHAGTPGSRPLIDHTGAGNNALSATDAIPTEIVGLSLRSVNANAIDLTLTGGFAGSGTLGIHDNVFRGAGAEGIDVNAGGTGTLTLDVQNNTWNAAGTHTGNAVDVVRTAGSLRLNLSDNTGILSAAAGVNVDGGAPANTTITGFANNTVHANNGGTGIAVSNATFDATSAGAYNQVAGGVTVIGASGDGVGGSGLVMNNVAGDLAFTDLDVFAESGTGVRVGGTGAVNVGAGTGTRVTVPVGVSIVETTGGPALDLNGLTADFRLTSLKSTSTATTGVSLVNVSDAINPAFNAAFSAGSGSSITSTAGATGPLFNVSGGNAAITYAGPITNTGTGRAVSITTWAGDDAGDDLLLSGAIDENGAGILVNGNGGSRAITFSGGMDIDTGANEGFAATSNTNALGLHITGTNTIDTTTAAALRVIGTQIGNSGLTFRSITAGTGAGSSGVGIALDGTGTTAGNGGLTVTGNATPGSGGMIQHKTGADGSTTAGIGIFLKDTKNASFNWMQLNDFDNSAVTGRNVQGFTLQNSVINGVNGTNSAAAGDGAIYFGLSNPGGTNGLQGTGLIRNTKVRGAIEHNVEFYNQSGSMNLTIEGVNAVSEGANPNDPSDDVADCIIEENSVGSGSDGVLVEMQGTSTATIVIDRCLFRDNKSQAVQVNALNSTSVAVTIDESVARRFDQGNEGFILSNGSDADMIAMVSNNRVNAFGGTAIFVGQAPGNATAASDLHATISGNVVTQPTTATNHGIIVFLTSTVGQLAPARIRIDGNNVTNNSTSGTTRGILVDIPDTNTSPVYHATVSNNTVSVGDNVNGVGGLVVQARQSSDLCANIHGNTVNFPNGTPAGILGLRARQVAPAAFDLEQSVGCSGTAAAVLACRNPGSTTEVLGTITVVPAGTCLLPVTP
jgi:hypothetical protein